MWVVVKIRVPFWGTLNSRCRIMLGTPKGTIILTTTHVSFHDSHKKQKDILGSLIKVA